MEEQKSQSASTDSNLMAALSYVWVLSIVMLIVKKDDEFVKFHAKQGTVLFVASIIGMSLSTFVLFVGPLIGIVVVVLEIFGFIKALSGERYKVPVVGDLAEKIKL
ncbi:MAG: DUF4870 domain-containing protein [Patescibacteria group bacterium]